MTPFIDESGSIDTDEVWLEVVPLAKLVGLFVGIAIVPAALAFLGAGPGTIGVLLSLVSQFVLAVGAGIVLMYVVARGIDLADRAAPVEADEAEED